MKSYEEMAKNVLRRRDEILAQRRRKKILFYKYAASVSALAAIALVAVSAWRIADHEREFYNFDSSSEDEETTETTSSSVAIGSGDGNEARTDGAADNGVQQQMNTNVVVLNPDGTVKTIITSPDDGTSPTVVTKTDDPANSAANVKGQKQTTAATKKHGATRFTSVTTGKNIGKTVKRTTLVTKRAAAPSTHVTKNNDSSKTNTKKPDTSAVSHSVVPTTEAVTLPHNRVTTHLNNDSEIVSNVTKPGVIPETSVSYVLVPSTETSISKIVVTECRALDPLEVFKVVAYNGNVYYADSEYHGSLYESNVGGYIAVSGTDPYFGESYSTTAYVREVTDSYIIVEIFGTPYVYTR